MKEFLKMTGAVLTGLVVWGIVQAFFVFFMFAMMAAGLGKSDNKQPVAVDDYSVLRINLCDAITDRSRTDYASIYSSFSFDKVQRLGLNDISRSLYNAANDDKIVGLYINCSDYNLEDIATADALRELIVEFKKRSHKPVYAFSNSFNNLDYYVATACDSIYMRVFGDFLLNGLCSQSIYYKGALDKFGIEAQVIRHGKFKAAVEPYLQEKMSDANKLQITTYLSDIWNVVTQAVSDGRGIDRATIDQMANSLDYYSNDRVCIDNGFIDGVMLESDFDIKLATEMGSEDNDGNPKYITIDKYVDSITDSDKSTNEVAVLYAAGEIVSEDNGEQCITSKALVDDIKAVAKNDDVKAVVLRINSPGGSAVEAEIIYQELLKLKGEKPIVVSMGGYAASGGYYIASCADRIFAEPNTITGSIGVFGLLLCPQKLLNNTLGLNVETVSTHDKSDFMSAMEPKSASEIAILQRSVENIYDVFVQHVADGRNMTFAQVDSIAQGRVWTGTSASQIGLVDDLGGLEEAILYAAQHAELEDGYKVKEYPEDEDDGIMKIFSQLSGEAARAIYGNDVYEQRKFVEAFKQRTGVQALAAKSTIR
ncbi:MAG: signal peptide peptidase SppA [Bacteroidales bacterium]|nr:signal peptide peptidase SppA [Bacteroidales bacterium]